MSLDLTAQEKIDLQNIVTGISSKQLYEFETLQSKLYHHFLTKMPYGIARANDGDPDDWIIENLIRLMNEHSLTLDEALIRLEG